ncbi:hypothetical protein F5Y19DRAFT_408637 [Xylariaceae sp. FL1651]|nr:hypothetical protein F5Y19DRAFT_408637 [Xylariaceae sp. FL1651]
MLPCTLKFVRKDNDRVVYTEHPDHIHPRDLSLWLEKEYGEPYVRVSLRKEIYVIYIARAKVDNSNFCTDTATETEPKQPKIEQKLGRELIPDIDQIYSDIDEAIEVLREARRHRLGISEAPRRTTQDVEHAQEDSKSGEPSVGTS